MKSKYFAEKSAYRATYERSDRYTHPDLTSQGNWNNLMESLRDLRPTNRPLMDRSTDRGDYRRPLPINQGRKNDRIGTNYTNVFSIFKSLFANESHNFKLLFDYFDSLEDHE